MKQGNFVIANIRKHGNRSVTNTGVYLLTPTVVYTDYDVALKKCKEYASKRSNEYFYAVLSIDTICEAVPPIEPHVKTYHGSDLELMYD